MEETEAGRSGSENLLEATDVTKTFGSLRAVDGLGFAVAQGEILGIAGPNGAGKSTLFNVLSAAPYSLDSGSIVFDGSRIDRASPRHICRAGLLRTFQTETVFESLSVWDNVRVAARYGSGQLGRRGLRAAVAEALATVELAAVAARSAGALGLAAKKRLMLASALVCRPKLLLLDEPASGLNDQEQEELVLLIRQIHARGVTLIVIEHVLPLLLRLADRLLIMAAGRCLVEGEPATILQDERVIEAYVGRRATE